MPWHTIAETVRCKGRPVRRYNDDGDPVTRRCKTILWVGTRFYLHANAKPYCEDCALDPDQDVHADSATRPAGDHAVDAGR